ncbi:MAG TPA: DEAD/DEAH box helicase [Longimicrobiaceae bacterium]
MAHHAVFIGIDKHSDPHIPELTGARRDALALSAIFLDSIPGLDATRLVDEGATGEAIRAALERTLGDAEPDDTVIVTYSGHGSPDHRLIPYDTQLDSLDRSAISMGELAALFNRTRARAVLCVLDCCYSGGAPARVLSDAPVPRAFGETVRVLEGEGRFIIAAANINEPAWEIDGQGLLTRALLQVLSEGDGPVNLQVAMGRVMDVVRADAARLGKTQTPVCWNHVQGGLYLPPLRRGEHYRAAFPETAGATVSADLADLEEFGIPAAIIAAWHERFPALNLLQLAAVNDFRVLDGESLLVVAPTSSGKTFIGELAAARAVLAGRKAVFLLPYKALVNEKYEEFSALYGERLGLRVVRCSGDYSDQTGAFMRGRYDLAFLTYETFLAIAVGSPGVLERIGLVVLDEAQFITDPTRGITVELLLTYLITARARGVRPQLVALSAVIGEVNDFDGWLGCKLLLSEDRPVPLVEGVLDRTGTFQYLDASGEVRTERLLEPAQVRQRRDAPSSQDVIVPLVRRLVGEGEKVIIFRNQKGSAQGCASYLAADLGLPPAEDALGQLPGQDLPSTSAALRRALAGGTAFHTANLTREEKAVVETAFRDADGRVRVLAATTGVAAGINTPASTVILAEQEFLGEDGRPFTVAEYKNMAGRAGRLGFKEQGRAIILADTGYQRDGLFRRYVLGRPEPLRSSFDSGAPETWVVRLLAQVERVPRDDVATLLANTYGGYRAARQNPGWLTSVKPALEGLVARMIRLGLLEPDGEYVQLTLLGRVCGASHLSFESALRLVELLRDSDPTRLDAVRLMALLQILPESDGGYTPVMKKGQSEAVRPREVAERYGADVARALQRLAADMVQYHARCKRAAILWDWVEGASVESIEKHYTPNFRQGVIGYADIRRFADLTRFHLRSAHQIASVLFPGQAPDADAVEKVLKRLEVGLPEDALELLELPVALTRGQYLALYRLGARTAEDVWSLGDGHLSKLVGEGMAERLARSRPLPAAAASEES